MARGWFRKKKGKLVYYWMVLDASERRLERSKVIGAASLTDAEAWEKVGGLKAAGKIKMDLNAPPERVTFSELALYYLSHKEWRKESTKDNHTQIVNNLLIPQFGVREAVAIRPKEIKDWLKALGAEDSLV